MNTKSEVSIASKCVANSNHFENLLVTLQKQFNNLTKDYTDIFTTDANENGNLWEIFISNLPIEKQKYYTCNACKKFIESYGGLVCIKNDGTQISPFWMSITSDFGYLNDSLNALYKKINRANITGVFLSSDKKLGIPKTGDWTHLAILNNSVFKHSLLTAFQKSAEKLEDFGILQRGLKEFSNEIVKQALTILNADALYRSEKVIGVAKWLNELQEKIENTKNEKIQHNIIWKAVASAPPGFCHIRSSMIGTLLEDLVSGLAFDEVKRKFSSKMNPLQYQRPQAAPSEGNIKQAEKIIEKLNAEGSLARRFAKLEDLKTHWIPPNQNFKNSNKKTESENSGVFSHLIPKNSTKSSIPENNTTRNISSELPSQVMTWEKFNRVALPNATKIEYYVENGGAYYTALVTASNSEAPPILQWDEESERNPVSWYVYGYGSYPQKWNLIPNKYCNVTAITFLPPYWHSNKYTHFEKDIIFVLENCKDTLNGSLSLFPETLKSEFHSIRSTIEAFSKKGKLEGFEEASACGIRFDGKNNRKLKLRVTDKTGNVLKYELDRID